jgi:hypothetical protein
MAKYNHLQGFEGQDLRNEHTHNKFICLFRACLFSPNLGAGCSERPDLSTAD